MARTEHADGAAAAAPMPAGAEGPRERVVRAMGEIVAADGHGAATVSAVVARARVSRRTFYEHFADRDDCFLAAYRAMAGQLRHEVLAATAGAPWPRRLDEVIDGYLEALAARPGLARTVVIDVFAAGPAGVAARREAMDALAAVFVDLVADARREGAVVHPLSHGLALALLGGFEELVLRRIEEGRPASLPELAPEARLLARRAVGAR